MREPGFVKRMQRAIRWPAHVLYFKRCDLTWRQAFQATHFWIWDDKDSLDQLLAGAAALRDPGAP